MNTLIFRTIAPFLVALMLLFSVFVLLRGHNEPGGGFIGGLIAASALAIYGIAAGVPAVRRAILFHPLSIAGAGLMMSAVAGLRLDRRCRALHDRPVGLSFNLRRRGAALDGHALRYRRLFRRRRRDHRHCASP